MSAKTYLRILQGGILVSLMIIFFVFKDLLFPFITSKQLSFNILMELLLVVLVVLWLRYPAYRPKRSFITYGLLAYFLTILASCAVSVDISLSFWGDAERMLGLFHLAHFFIFYLIIITAFRSWRDWQVLFLSSVAVATVVSLIGLFGESPYSTIGNTAYVSGYLIFGIYFVFLLFFRSENKGMRCLYLLPLFIMLMEFKNMRTSGAIIALGVSILLLFLLLGLSHANKKVRVGSLISFLVAVVAILVVFSQSDAAWFQNSFLRNLTSQKATFQTRLISWRGAVKDFHNHPVIGVGFGNYAIIFDKMFDSKFYNYATGDTYFDRAHNNLIDIASTTGLVGLITYLSIFLAAAYYLWNEFKLNGKRTGSDPSGLNNIEIIILTSLLAAYFIQNLAIFDSFTTLMGLTITLGFIYWLNFRRNNEKTSERQPRFVIKSDSGELICLIIFLLATFIFTNYYNIKTFKMFQGSIDAYTQIAYGQLEDGVVIYKNNLVGRPMERDARVTLIHLIVNNPSLLDTLSVEKAFDVLDYVVSLAKLNVSENPGDSLMQLQLAQILDVAARYSYSYQNLEKFNFYSPEAMQAIDLSIKASPGRATTYFVKAQMLLFRQENDEVVATMKQGIALNPDYAEGHCLLAQMLFFIGDSKYDNEVGEAINNCLDRGGVAEISSVSFLKSGINYYASIKDYDRAATLSERLAEISEPDSEIWNNQARLYYLLNKKDQAEAAFQKALALNPTLVEDWNEFKAFIDANRKEE